MLPVFSYIIFTLMLVLFRWFIFISGDFFCDDHGKRNAAVFDQTRANLEQKKMIITGGSFEC